MVFHRFGDDKAVVFINGYEMGIERFMVGCRKAKTVLGVETVFDIRIPSADMARLQYRWHIQPRHATFAFIISQHQLSEYVLVHSYLHESKFLLAIFVCEVEMPFKIAPGCSCNQRFRPLRDSPTGGFRRHPGNDAILKLFCSHKLPVGADRRRTEVFGPVAWRVKFRQHRTAGSFSLFQVQESFLPHV